MTDKVFAEKSMHSGLEKEEFGMPGRVVEILQFIKETPIEAAHSLL